MINSLAHVTSLLLLAPAIGIFIFCTFVIALFVRVVLWEVWQRSVTMPVSRYAASAFLVLLPEIALALWAAFAASASHNKNIHRILVAVSGLIISILEIFISASIHKTAALEIRLFLVIHFAWLVIVGLMFLGNKPSQSLYMAENQSTPHDNDA
jgi:hypothetical protein